MASAKQTIENICCLLCSEVMSLPRVLPCSHSFCENCLKEWHTQHYTNKKENVTFCCPVCNKDIVQIDMSPEQWVKSLPVNNMFVSVMNAGTETENSDNVICEVCDDGTETSNAEYWCNDCQQRLCGACRRYHLRLNGLKHHVTIPIEEADKKEKKKMNIDKICDCNSEKTVDFYCFDHRQMCCMECAGITTHRLCQTVCRLDEVSEYFYKRNYIESNTLQDIEQMEANIFQFKERRENNQKRTEKSKNELSLSLNAMYDCLVQLINENRAAMNENIARKYSEINGKYKRSIKKIAHFLQNVQNTRIVAKSFCEHGTTRQMFIANDFVIPQLQTHYMQLKQDMENEKDITFINNLNCDVIEIGTALSQLNDLELLEETQSQNTEHFVQDFDRIMQTLWSKTRVKAEICGAQVPKDNPRDSQKATITVGTVGLEVSPYEESAKHLSTKRENIRCSNDMSGLNTQPSKQIREWKEKDTEPNQHRGGGYSIYPYSGRETELGIPKYLYHLNSHLTIQVYRGNIIDSNTDALVFGEDSELRSNSRIANVLRDLDSWSFDQQMHEVKRNTKKIKIGKVFGMQLSYVRQNMVLCLVTPSWGIPSTTDEDCTNGLKKGVKNILETAISRRFRTVAMPLLATGNQGAPIGKAARIIIDKIHEVFADLGEDCILHQVHLVNRDQYAVDILTDLLEQRILVRSKEQNLARSLPDASNTMPEDADTKYDMHSEKSTDGFTEQQEAENCVICMDDIDMDERKVLHKCKHVFHKDCIDMQFKHKPACPTCNMVYGIIEGNQPRNGKMNVNSYSHRPGNGLPLYESYGYFEINYYFPDGLQKDDDPNPGQRYKGTSRRAFLPDNIKGRLILDMLKIAFKRRLTFTIGHCRTTGEENVVTWNDIHHKTSKTGGPQRFGYPDPDYFDRVTDELKVKGITPDDV